jgi:hypothetical protein
MNVVGFSVREVLNPAARTINPVAKYMLVNTTGVKPRDLSFCIAALFPVPESPVI